MSDLFIGDVANQTGIATSTIRYYESIGLLPQPQRISGRRRYNRTIFKQIKSIRMAQSFGWSLDEIKESFVDAPSHIPFSARWKARVPEKISELEALIQKATETKKFLEIGLECDCIDIDDCQIIDVIKT